MADLNWALNLRDGLSGNARKMGVALAGVRLGLSLVAAQAKYAASQIALTGNVVGTLLVGAAREAINSSAALKYALGGIGIAAAGAAAGVVAIGAAVVKTASFRESSITRLTALLGSQERGLREFKDAIRIAERTPYSAEEVVGSLAQLSSVFKDDDQRREIYGAISDFTATVGGGNVEVMKGVTKALTDIAGKGKVEMEELKGQLADYGLSLSRTLPEIAKLLGISGKTEAEILDKTRAAIKAGKVSGDVGVYAVYKALKVSAGGKAAGAATEAGAGSLAGLFSNIKEGFTTLIALQETERWPALIALKGLLRDVAGLFASDSKDGKQLVSTIENISTALTPMTELARTEFVRLKDGLVGNSVEAENFRRGLVGIAYGTEGVVYVVYGLYRVLAFAAGGIVQLFGAAVALGEWLGDFAFDAVQWGGDLIDGMISGLTAGWDRLKGAVSNLGKDTIATLKGVLGIASPSKEFARLGIFSGQGFMQGLQQVDVRGAAEGMAAEAAAGLSQIDPVGRGRAAGGQLASAAAGGGLGGGITVGDIHVVSSAADARQVAAEVRETLSAELLDQLRAGLQRMRQG